MRTFWFGCILLLCCFHPLKAQEIEDFRSLSLEELIRFLSHKEVDFVLEAVSEIGNRGEKSITAAPYLMRLLLHSDEWVCLSVSDMLCKLGPEVLSFYPDILQVRSIKARAYAYRSMSGFVAYSEKTLPLLAQGLKEKEEEVQKEVLHALWQFQEQAKSYIPQILPFTKSLNLDVQKEAILALSEIDPNQKEVIETFLSLVDVRDEGLKLIVGEAIAKVVPSQKEDLQLFLETLPQIENEYLRAKVVEAIGNAAQSEGVDALISYLSDPSSYVRFQSLKAIQKANYFPKKESSHLFSLFEDTYEPVRILAPIVVAQLQLTEAVPFLIPLLRDINPRVRLQVVKTLGSLTPPSEQQIRGLLTALQDVQMNIVEEAVVSLGNLKNGSLTAAPTLIRFTAVAKGEMLITLLRALGQIKPESEKALPTLQKVLEQNSDPITKIWCYHTLYEVHSDSRLEVAVELLKYLESSQREIHGNALEAIALLESPTSELVDALVSQYSELQERQKEFVYQRFQKLNVAHRLEPFRRDVKEK